MRPVSYKAHLQAIAVLLGIIIIMMFSGYTDHNAPKASAFDTSVNSNVNNNKTFDTSLDYNEATETPWQFTKDYQIDATGDYLYIYRGFKLIGIIPYSKKSVIWKMIEKDNL